MTLCELATAVEGARIHGDGDVRITAVTHDSREVSPGTLFVALPGRRVDGRRFIPAALANGAAAVALPFDGEAVPGIPVLRIPAPRSALAQLSARVVGDPAQRLTLAGLTGTNGKTTVSSLVAQICRAAKRPEGLVGTISHWIAGHERPAAFTTPEAPALHRLFTEMVQAGVEIAVMEVSSIGLSEHRVDGLDFAVAGFLNLSVDHLDYHEDMAQYGAAKRRLFCDLLARDGVAIINVDDAYGLTLAEDLGRTRPDVTVWALSLEDATQAVHFEGLKVDGQGVRGRLHTPYGQLDLESPLLGRFNAANLAMAASMAMALELPGDAIVDGLAKGRVRGRMEGVPNPLGVSIVVDYAHSPDALERVLSTLRPLTTGTLWCVFGCGGDRDATKRPAMGHAAAAADIVVITSDNPRSEEPEHIALQALVGAAANGRPVSTEPRLGHTWLQLDRRTAIRQAIASAAPGDTLLIAGKGHETYQEIDGVKHPFDDVEEARRAVQEVVS